MLFVSFDDFLNQVSAIVPLTREEAKNLGIQMAAGEPSAREQLIRGHLPYVAAFIRRGPQGIQTLHTVYACIDCLERRVDRFDFSREQPRFIDDLSKALRQCLTRCIAER